MGWSEWRDGWPEQRAGAGCGLCLLLGTEENAWGVRVLEGEYADGYLWRPGGIPGYCVVLWKHGHVTEPTDLGPAEAAGYWLDVVRLGRALVDVYRPAKMNYETLGNNVPHLHTHVVPRPDRDPAPNGPLPWRYLDVGRQPDQVVAAGARLLRRQLDKASPT